MTETTKAVVFNAIPLLLLAGAYAAVSAALLPALWRGRARAHPLDWAIALIFPGIAVAGAIFAILVLHDQRPLGGHLWLSLAATLAALAPALLLLARWRDRAIVVGGIGRTLEAEELVTHRDREIEAVAELSTTLGRARDPVEVARPLVERVASLLGLGFAGVVAVDDDRKRATGVYGERDRAAAPWWDDLEVDLDREPSGIASAVFDAAPVTVFDIASSPLVSRRLAELVGAESGAWIPLIAQERVIGVLVAASTAGKRAFSREELALLQALAAEAALALERLRSAAALSDALAREQAVAEVSRRIRSAHTAEEIVRVAGDELRRVLHLDEARIDVVDERAQIVARREAPLGPGEQFLADTVEREVDAALQTARLLAENHRQLERQTALLHAARVVTSELDIDSVLQRLVEEVTTLLAADAADCYLLDPERGVLRCAAVHGFDESLVGFEFVPDRGVAGAALRAGRPVSRRRVRGDPRERPESCVRRVRARARRTDGLGGRDTRRARRRAPLGRARLRRGGPRAARGVRVPRVARAAQRRELRRALTAGARAARLLPHRLAARRAPVARGDA